ncbi:FabG Dehydrogenase with different specificities related to short-chain alcohol dehydrogenase [Pyrenophora tritici-repentis]|uniref:Short chain dehydrogenase n=1 Tax=Pyrenophora tritici-repentis TaxID=45151 RepID=A0A2W1E728_9PLEO|nr:retinol dehydrogenase 12 [Pyrenophora tritici-repentis]KAF7445417.1 retinol dehydrogenase 12 [Pyrenophora tritici-repentis]KAG9380206.1 retinol dehydrogenase 12 [Pyrenophora tritici-repentis]KAI1512728.1 short chain dehydrogenase [Pyrenophora tritici-repentis]KAI1530532.1 FabG Dehydrogenase with different specificities related to short-chain alcohol dehydrogenase [Pyrenophora tritici-repentis]
MASNAGFNKETGGLEVAKTYSSLLAGKTVLITGVSPGGIGEAIARSFAHGGASLIIATGRSRTRVEETTRQIATEYPSTQFLNVVLNLVSLQSVRQAANEILGESLVKEIHIVVTNAGGLFNSTERQLTIDGLEIHFGTNHLGHFLLVQLLLPKLLAAAKRNPYGATRIVAISSFASYFSPFRFSDYNFDGDRKLPIDEKPDWLAVAKYFDSTAVETDRFSPILAYGQSKTANVLFVVQLNRLLSKQGIYAFAIHPGAVYSTGGKHGLATMPESVRTLVAEVMTKDIDQGSATALVAALDPSLSPEKGVWLSDCQLAEPAEWAVNEEKAERLWKLSEELVEKLGN